MQNAKLTISNLKLPLFFGCDNAIFNDGTQLFTFTNKWFNGFRVDQFGSIDNPHPELGLFEFFKNDAHLMNKIGS